MKLSMPRFDHSSVLVVGDVMLDRYWHGVTSRISPEAPVPVVKVGEKEDRPGGAGNVALNIAALGAPAYLVGVTGDDEASHVLQACLEAAGVWCSFQQVEDEPTITKLRIISRHQQLIRLDFEEAFKSLDEVGFTERFTSLLQNVDVVVLSDYGKGALAKPQQLIQAAKAAGKPVLVDPKGTDFAKYRGATLITPNFSEFEAVVGTCPDEATLTQKGMALLAELELDALLVTRSEHGMTLLRPSGIPLHLPAQAKEVFDVTGAGDTVIAVIASALGAGLSLPESVALANLAAGIVVGKLGTATVSAPELRRALQGEPDLEKGVMTADQLLSTIEEARAQGEKVVFTNGCFDILHAGHVGYLEQARSLGDRLVVAINDDASVRRLKGEGRPVNPVDRRMTVLAGLAAVDWVVSFNEDTPESLLQKLKPDVLVKGGDYTVDKVVGGEIVHSYGGQVAVLDFLDDCSTTAIVNKIKSPKLTDK
ncbi:bifunctional D-glycero-beta-D-manno-heptose-7-phosphate kinase/D-glycero-beta-D-manno-heptose 1-phosphate adenylyltransferase HldE [Zooshikella marina]|uniref:bifunctional D-glycero-beta-D-manno-heptose-7-phosphate kinase/D-glycero-beta-D-manno-heptose 1-phosphate adenylyltransferase HldE n=1 Tax=Zooshikella ganghwensis TaxID=202772 RepID=UPI001BB035A8|nr:bifunctional D-glycero-beta-D-manno-heptose-7-phosphate kinase/D-glycero-beta-D-manno-heptose 1-phosphate adenylyltransferase HldE [Zooshikella ganghwensis]MBU2706230.1 bifunctional D-glycero-beta-D-manno-heptose-7-phosphate kinase/D-glycero-beta-D-manno-heptose 1-phosphate adenylyltransferase HldE [Zooshikella ganghwensis]